MEIIWLGHDDQGSASTSSIFSRLTDVRNHARLRIQHGDKLVDRALRSLGEPRPESPPANGRRMQATTINGAPVR